MNINYHSEPWATAILLLNQNQLGNAHLNHVSQFKGFKLSVDTTNSWCDFKESGETAIYLKPEEYKVVNEQIAVACHEVGHAINYRTRRTNIKKLQFYTNASKILFPTLFIVSVLSSWVLDITIEWYIALIALTLLSIFVVVYQYHNIYKADEVNAWTKGKEIYSDLINRNIVLQNVNDQSYILDYIDQRTELAQQIKKLVLIYLVIIGFPLSFLVKAFYSILISF